VKITIGFISTSEEFDLVSFTATSQVPLSALSRCFALECFGKKIGPAALEALVVLFQRSLKLDI
jgi:hypothetical protein